MTGEQFVQHCRTEADAMQQIYTDPDSETAVSEIMRKCEQAGASRADLAALVRAVIEESWYTMLCALDGTASLDGEQQTYQLHDEDGKLLNPCGELEDAAYRLFMEEE